MQNNLLTSKTQEALALARLGEVFELLKRAFKAGGSRSPRLANAIDHTALALEGAGIAVGPPPEFGDELGYEEDEVLAYLSEFN